MSTAGDWIEKTLRYRFQDPARLGQALTHRSAGGRHNERLEFLGDAILGMIVAETLFHGEPEATEGYLSRLRARLVKKETLAEIGVEIRLGDWLKLGPGELKSGGHRRASILANGVEALLGAVYLDGGLEAARSAVETLYGQRLHALPAEHELKDPKTRLQELLQARGLDLPSYTIVSTAGDPHRRRFMVSCAVGSLGLETQAEGRSRRRAEQSAAEAMIDALADG